MNTFWECLVVGVLRMVPFSIVSARRHSKIWTCIIFQKGLVLLPESLNLVGEILVVVLELIDVGNLAVVNIFFDVIEQGVFFLVKNLELRAEGGHGLLLRFTSSSSHG